MATGSNSQSALIRQYEPLAEPSRGRLDDGWLAALGAEVKRNRFGEYIAARQWHATPAMYEPDPDTIELLLRTRLGSKSIRDRHAADPAKWLFLDTEATGFIGGAGNLAFLIGLAWWDSGGIQIEQLFMRDPAEEYSILFELARQIRKRPVLISFNGKSFDWPLLTSRFRLTRTIASPALSAHLDFLHPAREIWKLQIGGVRLGDLEEHVLGAEWLGWSRREDIDSARIPGMYFDYICGRAHRMESVFRHNRLDLRGLAAVAGRIVEILSTQHEAGSHDPSRALEFYGIARFFGRRQRHARARRYCECALDAGLPSPMAEAARLELARFIKRERRQLRLRQNSMRGARRGSLKSQMRRAKCESARPGDTRTA